MSDPDVPVFPPPPIRSNTHAYRSPARLAPASAPADAAPTRTVVRRPEPQKAMAESARIEIEIEPDALARALGPGRMPRFIMRYPRLSGAGLLAAGALGAMEVVRISKEGGVSMRALPAVTAIAAMLGVWLVIA